MCHDHVLDISVYFFVKILDIRVIPVSGIWGMRIEESAPRRAIWIPTTESYFTIEGQTAVSTLVGRSLTILCSSDFSSRGFHHGMDDAKDPAKPSDRVVSDGIKHRQHGKAMHKAPCDEHDASTASLKTQPANAQIEKTKSCSVL